MAHVVLPLPNSLLSLQNSDSKWRPKGEHGTNFEGICVTFHTAVAVQTAEPSQPVLLKEWNVFDISCLFLKNICKYIWAVCVCIYSMKMKTCAYAEK